MINEVLSANDTVVTDPANPECPEHDDFVELYNHAPEATSLSGVYLEAGDDRFFVPGTELGPGEHLLVWADGQPEQGPLHAPFGIDRDGERVTLWRGHERIDAVRVPKNPGTGAERASPTATATGSRPPPPPPGPPTSAASPTTPASSPAPPSTTTPTRASPTPTASMPSPDPAATSRW